ncbi:MAG: O-antigen ligase family protein [Thermoguttaceae bacterium]|nr:O-antigen ligase family protein [Thermoguttaceae bacterium]
MNDADKTSRDWPIILLTVWLTSRLFWTCDPSGFAFDYLWGLFGVVGAGCWFYFKKGTFGRLVSADLLVAAFFCLYFLSGALGVIHGDQRAAFNCLWSTAFYALIYLLVRQIVVTPERKRILLSSLMCGAVVLSVWAIYQRYVEYPADKAVYQANPAAYLQQLGIDPAEDSPARRSFEDRFFAFEPSASFSLTNSLAAFLTPCFVLLAAAWAKNWNRRTGWGLVAAMGFVAFAVALTHARAAMMGIAFALFCGAVYGFARVPGYAKAKWLITITFVILSTFAGTILLIWKPSVLDSAMLTLEYRFEYWDSALQMIWHNPWLGVGAGNFQNYYTQFMPATAGEAVADPHNFLLEIAAVSGIPAALIFWFLLGLLGYKLVADPDNSSADVPPLSLKLSIAISLASAVIGFCLGFLAMGQTPGPIVVLLCASVAAPLLIVPGIGQTKFSSVTLTLALIGLLTALMLSGGIAYTTIAAVFWTLTALIVNQTFTDQQESQASQASSNFASYLTVAGLGVLFALCYVTGFYPTTESAKARMASLQDTTSESQLADLEQSVKADSIAFQPRFDLAQWNWTQWTRTKNKEYFDQCVKMFHEAIERNPRSSVLWREYGIRLYKYGRESGDWSHENDAYAALNRACVLHQADYVARAYLALLDMTSPVLTPSQEELSRKALSELKVSENGVEEHQALITKTLLKKRRQDAQRWAQELVEFSDANIHQNRKIPASLREQLIEGIGAELNK